MRDDEKCGTSKEVNTPELIGQRSPSSLEPHYQTVYVLYRTLAGAILTLSKDTVSVFYGILYVVQSE